MNAHTLSVAVLVYVVLSVCRAQSHLEGNENWLNEENAEKVREARSVSSHGHHKQWGRKHGHVHPSHRLNPAHSNVWSEQIRPLGWSNRVYPKDWSKKAQHKHTSKDVHAKGWQSREGRPKTSTKEVYPKGWPSKEVHPRGWPSKEVHPRGWPTKVHPKDWSIQVHHKDWFKTVHHKDWFKIIRPTEWLSDIGSTFQYSKIYPGTNWCGDGHRAKNWAHLGRKWRPDTCCRGHDLCSHAVEAGKVKYGIQNHGPFTWSHCDCDREFYDCLKQARTIDSDIIGVAYFDVLNNYCIYEDYPQTCKQFLFFKVKCSKVKTKSKIWKKRKIGLTYFGKAIE